MISLLVRRCQPYDSVLELACRYACVGRNVCGSRVAYLPVKGMANCDEVSAE